MEVVEEVIEMLMLSNIYNKACFVIKCSKEDRISIPHSLSESDDSGSLT